MKQLTITVPDELEAELDSYLRAVAVPSSVSAVMEAALREYLERRDHRERTDASGVYRPFSITPVEERDDLGERDVSIDHDRYLADEVYTDTFGER